MEYEKRYYSETGYKLWQFITVWNKVEEDCHRYVTWLKQIDPETGELNKATILPYTPPAPIAFDRLKANKQAEIDNSYEQTRIETTFVTVRSLLLDGGKEYLTNVEGSIYLLENSGEATDWYLDADGAPHEFTLEDFRQIKLDMLLDGKNNFNKLVILREEVSLITEDTPENRERIANIKW